LSEEPIEITAALADWQSEDGSAPSNPLNIKLSVQATRIDVEFKDGRALWIEQENGKIRVHGYLPEGTGHCEPVNLDIGKDRFVVSTDAVGFDGFEQEIAPAGV